MSCTKNMTRRCFLGGAAAVAFTIVPSHVLGGQNGTAPSDKFTFAQIGVGGRGRENLSGTIRSGGILVGMADVDSKRAEEAFRKYKNVPKFKDFREMLDKLGDKIDGVVVSTPDHTHAVAAMAAIRRKKHVYCEKPLARTVYECRALAAAAREFGVVTQMGNQGHSSRGLPRTIEYLQAGAIGKVREVHCWTDRPGTSKNTWWPQGMTRLPKSDKVPSAVDWDLWIGPRAMTPYSEAYMPVKYLTDGKIEQVCGPWRGWWDYGCGAMGDMACHNMDPAFAALKLGAPTKVKVTSGQAATVAYPQWAIVEYTFPAIAGRGEIKLYWYEGGKKPKRPEGMLDKYRMGDNGCLFIGEDGVMMGRSHSSVCRIVGGKNVKNFEKPKKTLIRSEGHYREWIKAAQNQPHEKAGKVITPGSNFDYSGPMTEAILTGCIAMRYPGKELHWDAKKMQFTNNDDANKYVKYAYRKGWEL